MSDYIDTLPPTEYLVVDVLAARHRLGEAWWTFPSRLGPALRGLERRGLIELMHGNVEKTVRASLTDTGAAYVLSEGWKPAHERAVEDLAENMQDASGMRWWYEQGDRFGLSGSAVRGMAATAAESIRMWGRLIPVADWPRLEEMFGGDA